jgi:hypothetical protein
MNYPNAPADGLASSGICTRCQQDLILVGDALGCPVCGEHVLVSTLHAAIRLKIPSSRLGTRSPGAAVGSPARTTNRSQVTRSAAGAVTAPPRPTKPSSNFTELWKRLRKNGT